MKAIQIIITAVIALGFASGAFAADKPAVANFNKKKIELPATVDADAVAKITAEAGADLKELSLRGAQIADLAPLVEAFPKLEVVELRNCTLADLAPLAGLAELKDLSLYGSKVEDFGPLAGCAKLRKFEYYAVRDADYASLGKLTQVEVFEGGLTDMTDIAWMKDVPNLKVFSAMGEAIEDYTPLANTKVERLSLQAMRAPAKLTEQLADLATLTYLELNDLEDVTGFESLGKLTGLKQLNIIKVNQEKGNVDAAFLKTLVKLEKLQLSDVTVANFDAVAACVKLTQVDLSETKGIESLAPLKKLPALDMVNVTEGLFPKKELKGFGEDVVINEE